MSQTKLIDLDNLAYYDQKIKALIDQHEGSGYYSDLTNKPSINGTTLSGNKTTSDLGLFSGAYVDLSGKPILGTASAKDVPSSGNASTSQVVMGDDTRLSDSRPASDVSAWAKASTKPSYTASEVGAIATTEKGANNGVAELDSTGKVPSSQLPSYVDDVLEYNSLSDFPLTGETGKIYIAKDTNKTYRWSGSAYVEISESLALGETSSTAYAGNKGKANADAISAIKDGTSIDSFGDVETALADKQDAYETITYAQWQTLTPAQQAAKDYYISDYPSSQISAGNVSYNNSSSGMAAHNVQSAVDELNSGLIGIGNIKGIKTVSDTDYRTFDGLISEGNGIFSIVTNDNNTPDGGNNNYWYVLQVVFYTDNTYAVQFATSSAHIDNKVYMRKRTIDGWTNWKSTTFA